MKKIVLALMLLLQFSCHNSTKINRQKELDFEHPSISLSGDVDPVKQLICADWKTTHSILSKDTLTAEYIFQISYFDNETFFLVETKNHQSRSSKKMIAELFKVDENYVLRTDSLGIIPIYYLSDVQLKLNDVILEKAH